MWGGGTDDSLLPSGSISTPASMNESRRTPKTTVPRSRRSASSAPGGTSCAGGSAINASVQPSHPREPANALRPASVAAAMANSSGATPEVSSRALESASSAQCDGSFSGLRSTRKPMAAGPQLFL